MSLFNNAHDTQEQLLANVTDTQQSIESRCDAVQQISDIKDLLGLAVACHEETALVQAISRRMAHCVMSMDLRNVSETVIADYLNYMLQEDLGYVCIGAQERSLALAALTCLQDEKMLAQVVREAHSQQIACLAVGKIHTDGLLQLLSEHFATKPDSSQARAVHKQIQTQKKQQQHKDDQQQHLNQIVLQLNALDEHAAFDKDAYHSFLQLFADYNKQTAQLSHATQHHHQSLIVRLQEKTHAYQQAQKTQAHTQTVQEELLRDIATCLVDYTERLKTARTKDALIASTNSAKQAHKTYQSALLEQSSQSENTDLHTIDTLCAQAQWLIEQYDTISATTAEIDKLYGEQTTSLIDLLALLQRFDNLNQLVQNKWSPANKHALPPVLIAFYASVPKRKTLDALVTTKRTQAHTQAQQALAILETDLDTVGYARLFKRLRKIKHKAQLLIRADKIVLLERIDEIHARLEKQQDLHIAAVEPKLRDLCEQIEARIADYEQDNTASAQKIQTDLRQWQKQWQELSQGLLHNAYWTRFHAATERLHTMQQQCKRADDAVRTDNDQKRSAIIAELQAQYTALNDGTLADTNLTQLKNTFYQRWKDARPFSQKSKVLDDNFHQLMQQINAYLQQTYESAIASKKELIASVRTMTKGKVGYHDAQNRWRLLMLKWKASAHAGREEKVLWNELQEAKKAAFAQFRVARAQERGQASADVKKAKQLFSQLQALNEEDEQGYAQCQSAFHDIDWHNYKAKAYWEKKFAAVFAMQHKKHRTSSAAKNKQQQQLALVCDAVRDATAFHEQINHLPTQLKQQLQEAYGKATEASLSEQAVALEIVLGLDTPAEYHSVRTKQQMAALQAKFGSAVDTQISSSERYMDLLTTYVSTVSTDTQKALHARVGDLLVCASSLVHL